MKNNSKKKQITPEDRVRETIKEISTQIDMALTSSNTNEAVKDCLKTIIGEISSAAGMRVTEFSHVRVALPNVFDSLNKDYAMGVFHSLHAITQYDTDAFRKFYELRLDEKSGDEKALKKLAKQISKVMKNPLTPPVIYNCLSENLIEITADTTSPEWILGNLKKMNEVAK
jgi:hypothetical protein